MNPRLGRRLVAEALGTAMLILFGPGSVVAAVSMSPGGLTYPSVGMIAIAFGLIVAVVIYAFGSTSGAHINPAVTVALAATRRFPWREVGPYVAVQLAGAVAGGLLLVVMFGDAAGKASVGAPALGTGVGLARGSLVEAVGTFILVVAIMGLAVDKRAPAGWAGLMIGLTVTAVILTLGPLTSSSINPARAFGPLIAAAVAGGQVAWQQLPMYLLAPLVGAVLGAMTYDAVARPRDAEITLAQAEATSAVGPQAPRQGTQGDVIGGRR